MDFVEGPATIWERDPLQRLAREGQLMAFQHDDFWHPMDTLRDRNYLEDLWSRGQAPWRVWK
jgi:glucose-1-phosphate cytidylyltransferase